MFRLHRLKNGFFVPFLFSGRLSSTRRQIQIPCLYGEWHGGGGDIRGAPNWVGCGGKRGNARGEELVAGVCARGFVWGVGRSHLVGGFCWDGPFAPRHSPCASHALFLSPRRSHRPMGFERKRGVRKEKKGGSDPPPKKKARTEPASAARYVYCGCGCGRCRHNERAAGRRERAHFPLPAPSL